MKEVFLQLNKRGLLERVPDKLGNKAAWQKTTNGPGNNSGEK